ncbi:hypothetical protein SEUCBS139899_002589 [Sporothrix eucalyptigena]
MAASTPLDPLAGFSEPSEDEKELYFFGLYGRPRLVARTSQAAWQHDRNWSPQRHVVAKIGNHEIVHKWCPSLRNALISLLTNADDGHGGKLAWTSFYPIRFGRHMQGLDDKYDNPVVLMVGISKDDLPTWSAALRAALQCRDRLAMFGIRDVEVNMKTSSMGFRSSPAAQSLASIMDFAYAQPIPHDGQPDPLSAEINSGPMPLLPYPGHRIEQEPHQKPKEAKKAEHAEHAEQAEKAEQDEPQAGSLGLFLHLGTDVSTTYGLTCRHVAVGSRVPPADDICETTAGGLPGGLRILSGGAMCAIKGAKKISDDIRELMTMDYRKTERNFFRHPEDEEFAMRYQLQTSARDYSEKLREALLAHADACSNQDADTTAETNTTQRLVGNVTHSARHAVADPGYFQDWALVKLADNKDAVNKVYLAGSDLDKTIKRLSNDEYLPHRVQYQPPNLDEQGFLRIHGDGMPRIPELIDQSTHKSHLVAKRGATTGLRFGLTNEIEAVRRVPRVCHTDGPLVSLHLLALEFDSWLFSDGGDSGSCVFDMSGKVIGIIDGGERPNSLERFFVKHHTGINILPDASALPSQTPIPPDFSALNTMAVAGIPTPEHKPPPEKERDDVTFITPIQWILQSIAKFTGKEPCII